LIRGHTGILKNKEMQTNCNHLEITKWGGPLILSAVIASFSVPTAFNMFCSLFYLRSRHFFNIYTTTIFTWIWVLIWFRRSYEWRMCKEAHVLNSFWEHKHLLTLVHLKTCISMKYLFIYFWRLSPSSEQKSKQSN
jgi:hypothetical protein